LAEIDMFKSRVNGLEDVIEDVMQDKQLQAIIRSMSIEIDYREIVNVILITQADTCTLRHRNMSRSDKLSSIHRFVRSIAKVDQVDNITSPTMFTPPIQKGQMIYVDFAGVGAELDNQHFAIVWDDVSINQDRIIIIPVKSEKVKYKEYPHSFSIGKVDFLSRETWVDVRDITSISRKRIVVYQFESSVGANDHREVYLSKQQENRIEDALRVYWGKQKTLLDRILENNKERIPTFSDPPVQLTHMFRPIRRFNTSQDRTKTEYELFNDSIIYNINWKHPTGLISKGQRNQFIRKMAYASAIFNGNNVIADRNQSRQHEYAHLQTI
jgi:hypothetical protein